MFSLPSPLLLLKLPNEETTTQERNAQNSTSPLFSTLSGDRLLLAGILLLIWSEFCQSDPIRSGPILVLPTAVANVSLSISTCSD